MSPNDRFRAVIVGCTAMLIAVGCTQGDTDDTSPVRPTTSGLVSEQLSPQVREALDVATAFTEARAERDIDKMSANSIEGFINGFIVLSLGAMPAEFAWQDAVNWTIQVDECEVTEASESAPTIRCDVTHNNTISRALAVGPYPGSYHIKVGFAGDVVLGTPLLETTVTESHQTEFPIFEFTTETWRPFITWLEQNHPDDIDTMLGPAVEPGVEFMLIAGERKPLLSEESVSLWRQHTAAFAR